MRVLTCLNSLGIGGIEVTLLRCLPHFRRLGVQIDVACSGGPNRLDDEYREHGVRIFRYRRTPNLIHAGHQIATIARAGGYDVIHSRFGHTSGAVAIGADLSDTPLLVSFHSIEPNQALLGWERSIPKRWIKQAWIGWHRRAMRSAAGFIGHSEANLGAYEPNWRHLPDRFQVILNGIEFPEQYPSRAAARAALGLPDDSLVVLHVGSFKPEKNHNDLLAIFSKVRQRFPGAILVLVGDGPLRGAVEHAAQRIGITFGIRFEGIQRDTAKYYAAADVLLFPSLAEGYGNVLVEAQAAKLPIVASDIPAHREAVAPQQHKFLFGTHDLNAAVELLSEQVQAARAGSNIWVSESYGLVRDRNSIATMASRLELAYRSVVSTGNLSLLAS